MRRTDRISQKLTLFHPRDSGQRVSSSFVKKSEMRGRSEIRKAAKTRGSGGFYVRAYVRASSQAHNP